jgi:TolB-like protein
MARRALDLTPDDEVGIRRLMELLDRHGDRAGALRVYSEWQKRLLDEYGVEPAPETRKVARRVQAARKGESHETPPTAEVVVASKAMGRRTDGPVIENRAHGRMWVRTYALSATVVVAIAGLAGAIALFSTGAVERATDPRSVAVLPLRAIGGPAQGVEAERFAEELTTSLAMTEGVTVRSSSRAMDAVHQGGDVDRIGRRLGVAYVVDGGVQRAPARIRVTLRLVRTADGVSVWAGSYDAETTDPVTAARDAAGQAAAEIAARLQVAGQ